MKVRLVLNDWITAYEPVSNPIEPQPDTLANGGQVYEQEGIELAWASEQDPHLVWTIMAHGHRRVIVPGFVGCTAAGTRLGFFICQHPWDNDQYVVAWDRTT